MEKTTAGNAARENSEMPLRLRIGAKTETKAGEAFEQLSQAQIPNA